ncbi:MAG: YitT family protein [Candidatus Melainabacteria bacterium]
MSHKFNNKVFTRIFIDSLMICLGIISASFGLKGFLIPNNFIDGGVTGFSMLLSKLTHIDLAVLLVLVNIPFLLIGLKKIGLRFAIISSLSILGLALAFELIHYPSITQDKLLASIFGGFFLGGGIGIAIRFSSALDGTEILALILSKKAGFTVGDIILTANIVIFVSGAFLIGIESALYSILTYFSASRTADFIIHGLEEYTGITIISGKSEVIQNEIRNQTDLGVTIYKGMGSYSQNDQDIIFCVVTRLEINKVRDIVYEIDSNAFFFTKILNEVRGGTIRKLD